MSSIYELTGDWLHVYDMADDPEMDEDSWFGMMESIEADLEDKAENTERVIKEIEKDADALDEEAKRLTARAKAMHSKADRLKKNIEAMMIATEKRKFKTEHFSFSIQKNPPALKIAEDVDMGIIPPEFIVFSDPKIDRNKVKEAIKQGQEFDWAHMEQTEGIRIR